ncbi:MAG: hypothetical protein LBM78_01570, partial [Clostridiales bacterium]|nr:hypothetical protein [Clostridiales bacterium]
MSRIDCKVYTYNNLLSALSDLSARGASVFPIGESVAGRMILCVRVGDGCGAQLLVHGGIHAREHLTAALVAAMARYALEKPLPPHTGAYFVPMVNPDGVSLSQFGLRSLRDGSLRRAAAGLNAGEPDFTMWKANAAGVDLNCHFDAAWGEGARNVTTPGAHGYIGKAPGTAPESVALLSLTARVHPAVTV